MVRGKFKLSEGESLIKQGKNEIHVVGKGHLTYLLIGWNGCYGTLSGMKTLESLAAAIYRACGHTPAWLAPERKAKKRKSKK